MKKCKGCGVTLQYRDKNLKGYSPKEELDYCQRCFRLMHYGDINDFSKNLDDNINTLNIYKDIKDALYVLIVDCFDGLYLSKDKLLGNFKDKDVLLIINKIDLLPRNVTEDKIENLYINEIKKLNNKIVDVLLTYKNDYTFKDLFFEVINEKNYKNIVFVGRVNAGKSTIINKLLENTDLTTSIYPGTTVDTNEIEVGDYKFIDTPGLLDDESFITYIDNYLLKEIMPLKTIKAKSFQVYDNQSYSIEGLVDFDIKPKENITISFYINNNLDVHRTKLDNIDRYFNNNKFELSYLPFSSHDYIIDTYKTFYLKGLGLIKIMGKCNLDIRVNKNIVIYDSEVNI